MDGILRCAKYAFGPNRLHYCGPDANRELLSYIDAGFADPLLTQMLSRFQTLFPYLQLIARANNIKDPFDDRVVEAYWLGNDLLANVGRRNFYRHLTDTLHLKKKMTSHEFEQLAAPLAIGALPHHSYHVFSATRPAGPAPFSIETLDACRISWGTVTAVDGIKIIVDRRPVLPLGARLILSTPMPTTIFRSLDCLPDIDNLQTGQIITLHWSAPCEVINETQRANLEKYTLHHLNLVSRTSVFVR